NDEGENESALAPLGAPVTARVRALADRQRTNLSAPGPSPEEDVIRKELAFMASEIIDRLPREEREIIERHYFRGETLDEAAEAAGHGKWWASRLHARAMAKPQKHFAKLVTR